MRAARRAGELPQRRDDVVGGQAVQVQQRQNLGCLPSRRWRVARVAEVVE
ncbi:hypothetical protein [Planomonospora sp. ID82291]|nr:hypothetical protein [Planomonospora sp. ID82291]MBG0817984.1 hypothetical protein [Planomonospora sp. ID82291]